MIGDPYEAVTDITYQAAFQLVHFYAVLETNDYVAH